MVYDKFVPNKPDLRERIEPSWCDRPSIQVAPDLIGCTLVRQLPNGPLIRGKIVETESYAPDDPACHAYRGQSRRNASMFGPPGHSYVYLIYGLYHCLNVVTEPAGTGSAVLIRSLDLETIPPGLADLPHQKPHRIAAGPGKLCRALEIDRRLDGALYAPKSGLWLEPRREPIPPTMITQTTRIGITKAAEQPWRWYLQGNLAVSKG
ncbi:MAG: 3-methyladenine DNA glycosylase [Phormidesmis priestleyi]|uniref:Putative 3-methyladenine DNA glycosylase n=1 Tax=Phormidesmis priestleyi TaxID=268141 RepID=A0A2W4WZ77_9CYAN|nr:MAG: 3-methyladenine DNA glycosylase [Phormidesmis priestleyi]